jgi:hypothetical protein
MAPSYNISEDFERGTEILSGKAEKQPERGHLPHASHPPLHGINIETSEIQEKLISDLRAQLLKGVELRQPAAQFFINTLLQLAAFAAAIAFGVFAIKSVQEANRANDLASESNKLAIAANNMAFQANNIADESIDMARLANQLTFLALCLSSEGQVILTIYVF